jgi:hypothetical protein
MATTKCQLRSQVRELRAYAEALLAGDLPLSDGELSYLANVVDFTDEFLSEVAAVTQSNHYVSYERIRDGTGRAVL